MDFHERYVQKMRLGRRGIRHTAESYQLQSMLVSLDKNKSYLHDTRSYYHIHPLSLS